MKDSSVIRLLIVDDHPLFRGGGGGSCTRSQRNAHSR